MRRLFRLGKWLRRPFAILCTFCMVFAAGAFYALAHERIGTIQSEVLGETREYRIYFEGSDRIIYSLDGHMDRNAWIAASFYAIGSALRLQSPPTVVAVHSNRNRDIDFRNSRSTPTHWRPHIQGRAELFDIFLTGELIPQVEQSKTPDKRVLSGFSLSGLYALDLGVRNPELFDRIQVFSPTISHDTSIKKRLRSNCANQPEVFANWGLESHRDTEIFLSAMESLQEGSGCDGSHLTVRRHYGVLHALIMVTGHLERSIKV